VKKTVRVVTEREIVVEIKDELLTKEYLKELSDFYGSSYDTDKLFKMVAECCSEGYSSIEGVGEATSIYSEQDTEVKYYVDYEDTESEII
jgi:hypothetical protein